MIGSYYYEININFLYKEGYLNFLNKLKLNKSFNQVCNIDIDIENFDYIYNDDMNQVKLYFYSNSRIPFLFFPNMSSMYNLQIIVKYYCYSQKYTGNIKYINNILNETLNYDIESKKIENDINELKDIFADLKF
jgi:hypothetical protein